MHFSATKRRAIIDYDMAIKINSRDARFYDNRGVAHYRLGDYRRAVADFAMAIDLKPGSSSTYYNRAMAHVGIGQNKQAIEDLKTAAKLGSEEARNFLKSQMISW